ncbi:MAG TPA: two-component system response regulator CreB [Leptospiraceae bacterium]|nr:two-component system response regulator CreB [Leptospiraceae bacterium]HMW61496.1 two-component system response regulator CreB [Leptospiraceae bacterium]HMZ35622.1 two-component system response regulator CreB [Leptospiraceae bacterium]HNE24186.1 two-component system response regulator CreB [Leptospiraceae bacterium]HNJ33235.1 two-component system response regulator CreB [Leptospiraceae bacterium]
MKILIVEDEPAIADALLFALRADGFTADHARTAQEARPLVADADLLILDVGLPDTNGFDLLRDLRTKSQVPVLILTARSEEVDRIVGLELGADDYVTKPFSPREVVARARAILRRSSKKPDKQSAFDVDESRAVIRYFGKVLILSRTEYRMLALFLSRPGWVFTRENIMDAAWEEPEESFDRSVDTHIKNIRAKLKEIRSDLDPIVTRRGIGYSIQEDL